MTDQKPTSATPEPPRQQRVEAKDGATVQNVVQVGDNYQGDIIINAIQRVKFDYASRIRNFLTEYLGTPGQPVPFGGREPQMAILNQWLSNTTATPYALLAAPAGRGKSALLVRWLQTLDPEAVRVAFVPVSIRYNTALSSVVFAALAAQLAGIYEDPLPQSFHNWPGDQWRDLCLSYLSQSPPGDRQVLVILDGLDEAADWQAGADLFPAVPPAGLRVLVSARFLGGDSNARDWLTRLGWQQRGRAQALELPILTEVGVRAVLSAMGNPLDALAVRDYIVRELFRLSEGDPLLVNLYVRELLPYGEQSVALKPEDLAALKPGLSGYIKDWWEKQQEVWEQQGKDPFAERPEIEILLNLLTVALGPLTRDDLAQLAPRELQSNLRLQRAVRAIARFIAGDGLQQGYAFSHPRLNQYFWEEMGNDEKQQWQERFLSYGKSQLTLLNNKTLLPKDASPYVVQHYGAHLERARAESSNLYELVSEGWQAAWYALEGAYGGFLEDVARALQQAEAFHNIPVIIKCALCRSSVVTLSSNIFPDLLELALQHGLLSPRQSQVFMGQIQNEGQRAETLTGLAQPLKEWRASAPGHAYQAWCQTLRRLARYPRPEFLNDLRAMMPFTLALIPEAEQETAAAEIFQAIRAVATWWP